MKIHKTYSLRIESVEDLEKLASEAGVSRSEYLEGLVEKEKRRGVYRRKGQKREEVAVNREIEEGREA